MKITADKLRYYTDELTTAFYECPKCEAGIPFLHSLEGMPNPHKQTRYCPGCGRRVRWRLENWK